MMRGGLALYLIALGWYIRWSGLDADCVKVARGAWDAAVTHTAGVIRRDQAEHECEPQVTAAKAESNWVTEDVPAWEAT